MIAKLVTHFLRIGNFHQKLITGGNYIFTQKLTVGFTNTLEKNNRPSKKKNWQIY